MFNSYFCTWHKSIASSKKLQIFVIADIESFGSLASLAFTFYSMSCGPQLSGAMRKVTMCHPPLRGVMTPFQPLTPKLFPPLCKRLHGGKKWYLLVLIHTEYTFQKYKARISYRIIRVKKDFPLYLTNH